MLTRKKIIFSDIKPNHQLETCVLLLSKKIKNLVKVEILTHEASSDNNTLVTISFNRSHINLLFFSSENTLEVDICLEEQYPIKAIEQLLEEVLKPAHNNSINIPSLICVQGE